MAVAGKSYLNDISANTAELNYNDLGDTPLGTSKPSKVVTADASGHVTIADGAYNIDIASHDGTNGLKLGGTLVTSSSTELNYLDLSTAANADNTTFLRGDGTWNYISRPVIQTLVDFSTALSCVKNGTTTVTTATTVALAAGMAVAGTGIPGGTTIASITNATTLILSAAATDSLTSSLTFTSNETPYIHRNYLNFDGVHVIVTDSSGGDQSLITLSSNLQALSGLTSAANKGIQYTGDGTAGVYDLTAAGKALLDDANATAQRVTLGLVIGTDVQAYDADLLAIAGLTSAANKGIQFTGSGTAAVYDLTTAGKALLDDADATAQRVTLGLAIGVNIQAYDADLAAIAGLTSAANKGIQFTGSGAASVYDLTAAGKALLDDADAAAQRVTLGLGNVDNIADASQVSVGALNAGSITSGFTSIDVGSGAISTTGTLTATGELIVPNGTSDPTSSLGTNGEIAIARHGGTTYLYARSDGTVYKVALT